MTIVDDQPWDVIVVGGGNAALCAAMSAHDLVRRVLVIERSARWDRGGNSRHTRNIRCVHAAADDYNTGAYLFDELWKDLCGVGTGPSNEALAELTVRSSETVPQWMTEHGIRWQPPLAGTLHLGRTNRFFLGGGKALINAYHRTLEQLEIPVLYEATVVELVMEGTRCTGVVAVVDGQTLTLRAGAVVCASGGFEANLDWLRRYWGDAVDNYSIRGPRHNDGLVLQALYDKGAASAGEEKAFHAVAVDARSPTFDGGIATRLDMIPFAIVVNSSGCRFYDEGEELWPKRYAIWGRNIAEQPGQKAFSIWDAKVNHLFLPPMYGTYQSDTIAGLAELLDLPVESVQRTVDEYNAAVGTGDFDPSKLDGSSTSGLHPDKTNWAQRIDTAPYSGIAMKPGITFTYMGVAVDQDAHVRAGDGQRFENVFAAGEIMSGNILSTGYLAGFGLTIGTVWGRIAGRNAGAYVEHR